MKIRDSLATAAFFINLPDEHSLLLSGTPSFGIFGPSVDFLLKCANRVIAEIAAAYITLRFAQVFTVPADGAIPFSAFTKPPAHILKISKNGQSLPFKEFADHILIDTTGEVDIEYSFIPATLKIDDPSPFREALVSDRLIGYGIAAEYFLINGQPDEAIVWDKRYRDSLKIAKKGGSRERRVRARGSISTL